MTAYNDDRFTRVVVHHGTDAGVDFRLTWRRDHHLLAHGAAHCLEYRQPAHVEFVCVAEGFARVSRYRASSTVSLDLVLGVRAYELVLRPVQHDVCRFQASTHRDVADSSADLLGHAISHTL